MSLGRFGREGRWLPESGEFCKKRPAVGKKALVACTQIIQPSFAVRRPENTILRAPSVTKFEDVAFQAIAGKGVPFELSECPLRGTFDEIDQSGLTDIPQVMFPVDEVIADKEISIVLNNRNIPAGFLKDAQGMLLPQGCCSRLLKDLNSNLPDILARPLIEDGAKESAEGLGRHGGRAHAFVEIRSGLHEG